MSKAKFKKFLGTGGRPLHLASLGVSFKTLSISKGNAAISANKRFQLQMLTIDMALAVIFVVELLLTILA